MPASLAWANKIFVPGRVYGYSKRSGWANKIRLGNRFAAKENDWANILGVVVLWAVQFYNGRS